jgi:hypothetical protein
MHVPMNPRLAHKGLAARVDGAAADLLTASP